MGFKMAMKGVLRPVRDFIFSINGFAYDFSRFARHGGWRKRARLAARDYKAVKIYHRLEKSLSFRERSAGAGMAAAHELMHHLDRALHAEDSLTFHEKIGFKVLGDYVDSAGPDIRRSAIADFDERHRQHRHPNGGAVGLTLNDLQSGRLADPEAFFNSRSTVRDFASAPVPASDIERALGLALKSPSVCNRQASYVYCLHSRREIDLALSLQNGNRGFGHEIPCLLVMCTDLAAFDNAGERYQHWIDGGMFSMSMVWALHSLGYSSCCLNWSKTPRDDRKIRKLLPIKPEHSILMMLGVGLPKDSLKACYSARKPVSEYLEIIS
jgi:nitroreductase